MLKNEKKSKEFLDHLEKYFMEHKIADRVDRLLTEAP
jgi:hypothetical protein